MQYSFQNTWSHKNRDRYTTDTYTQSSKASERAKHLSGNAITKSKYSLPPLFTHTAIQSLKLPYVDDQQTKHKQQQLTLATVTVSEEKSQICQEDATGYVNQCFSCACLIQMYNVLFSNISPLVSVANLQSLLFSIMLTCYLCAKNSIQIWYRHKCSVLKHKTSI